MPQPETIVFSPQQLAAYAAWTSIIVTACVFVVRLIIKAANADLMEKLEDKFVQKDGRELQALDTRMDFLERAAVARNQ